mmetsp:Transcript_36067/g.70981  ORF Transcript_36067/g.70981 Transcript_36067/m.70981 type:complete len:83 (-) Transcript_36067:493-741(-)
MLINAARNAPFQRDIVSSATLVFSSSVTLHTSEQNSAKRMTPDHKVYLAENPGPFLSIFFQFRFLISFLPHSLACMRLNSSE